uniref:Uncharacterized protein n=1 Tax=Anopheles funestus TaxID=62324 RepID=A0A182REH9_ANOFN
MLKLPVVVKDQPLPIKLAHFFACASLIVRQSEKNINFTTLSIAHMYSVSTDAYRHAYTRLTHAYKRRHAYTRGFISSQKLEDVPEKVKFKFTTKHRTGVMVFGADASNGLKMPPVFIKAGMKDKLPCHTSKKSQECLKNNMAFGTKDVWSPSSPDLNLIDYSVWVNVQAKTCVKSHPRVDALKASITKA